MEQAIFLKKEQRQLKTDLHFDYCGISKTLPFHAFGPAIRQNYTLHIVMEGKGTYQVKNQQYHLKKGDLFLIRPGDSTFYLADGEDPWMYGWLSFGGAAADEIIHHSQFKKDQYTMVSSDTQKYINTILACLPFVEETLTNELHLNELTYRFLAILLEDGGKSHLGNKKVYYSARPIQKRCANPVCRISAWPDDPAPYRKQSPDIRPDQCRRRAARSDAPYRSREFPASRYRRRFSVRFWFSDSQCPFPPTVR